MIRNIADTDLNKLSNEDLLTIYYSTLHFPIDIRDEAMIILMKREKDSGAKIFH